MSEGGSRARLPSVMPAVFSRSDGQPPLERHLDWMVDPDERVVPVRFPSRGGESGGDPVPGEGPGYPEGDEGTTPSLPAPDPDAPPRGEVEAPPTPCQRCIDEAAERQAHTARYLAAVASLTGAAGACELKNAHAVEGALLELSLEIAGAIAAGMVEVNPSLHLELVRAALAEWDPQLARAFELLDEGAGEGRPPAPVRLGAAAGPRPDPVKLRVGDEAYRVIQDHLAQVPEFGGWSASQFELVRDPELAGLGCIVESTSGAVDGMLATRLAGVREVLRDTWTAFGTHLGEEEGVALVAAEPEKPAPATGDVAEDSE